MSVGGISGNGGSPWDIYTMGEPSSNQDVVKLSPGDSPADLDPVAPDPVAPKGDDPEAPVKLSNPLGSLFSQMTSVGTGGTSSVNGIKSMMGLPRGPLVDFQQDEKRLYMNRVKLNISAQTYEQGIRQAQKKYTEKTGEPAPVGMADPGANAEIKLLNDKKEEELDRLNTFLNKGLMTFDEYKKAADQVKNEYDQKIANLSDPKPIYPE